MTNNVCRLSLLHIYYQQRLVNCNLLPLSYRHEILDLTFLLKSLNGNTGYQIKNYINFVNVADRRLTWNLAAGLNLTLLRRPTASTTILFPERAMRTWNNLPDNLKRALKSVSSTLVIKQHLEPHYKWLLATRFDPENTCTWLNPCACPRCRQI